jgi:hypothetical protein
VRALVAELLPTGVGSCRSCTAPVVWTLEAALGHYSEHHLGRVLASLGATVFIVGVFAIPRNRG